MPSARRCGKAPKEKIGKKCMNSDMEVSRAVGAAGAHKAKRFVCCESSQLTETKSFTIWLAKRTLREEIKRGWSCGKSTSKTHLWPWTKP